MLLSFLLAESESKRSGFLFKEKWVMDQDPYRNKKIHDDAR